MTKFRFKQPMQKLREKIRGFFARARKEHELRVRLAVLSGVALGTGIFLILRMAPEWRALVSSSRGGSDLTLSAPADTRPRRIIDGVRVEIGDENPRLFGVMVENMVDARPLSGLAAASLVFEAPVEAGITRMLAMYPSTVEVSEIGPVRSARPYYLDWAREFNALYVHVGGSPEALSKLPTSGLDDLDEFSGGRYFWRSSRRYAPHNAYTSTEIMREALENRGIGGVPEVGGWIFKDDAPASGRPASQEVTVPFSTPTYEVTWRYHPESNSYERSQAGTTHRDRDGAPIVAKNIAVIFTDVAIIDEVGRRRIRTTGSGRGYAFLDGITFDVTWRKTAASERLRFFLPRGDEVEWNAGSTWIEIVPEHARISINNTFAAGPSIP